MIHNSELQSFQRILYPDILRTIAVFAVIMIHFCAYGFCNYDVYSLDWQIINAYESWIRWAVPVFVMVSGMFFLDQQKEITLSKLYRKNILRLVVAVLFWGFLYQVANVAKRIALENANPNVAVVDVQAVVTKSAQVQALKKEQQTKMQDLEKWLNTAKADVKKQKTQEGKEKLLKKYLNYIIIKGL